MSLFEWCKLAHAEYKKSFPQNHNFINWLTTINQRIVDNPALVTMEKSISAKLVDHKLAPEDKNSSNILYHAIAEADDSGVDVRRSGPKIPKERQAKYRIFANVTLEKYSIPYRSNDNDPTARTSTKTIAKTKGGKRPGGSEKARIVWLTPAEDLLKKIGGHPVEKRISYAARLLGLDRAGAKCRLDFYSLRNAEGLFRPNIFTDVDPIRWACTSHEGDSYFGCTLDAVDGTKSLPEAVALSSDLEGVNPDSVTAWSNETWFVSLKYVGFKGEVSNADCPDLKAPSKLSREFRQKAAQVIEKSKTVPVKCVIDCKDSDKCEVVKAA